MIDLVSQIVEAGPALVCDDCGGRLVTLREDADTIEIGCPACCDAQLSLVRGMIDKLDAAIDKAKQQLLPITHLPGKR